MIRFILIACGGAVGALSRYAVSALSQRFLPAAPWGTLIVNVSGCFAIGFLWGFVEKKIITTNMRFFLFTGILGGYTTFSTFGLEAFDLLRAGEMRLGAAYVLASMVFGVGAVFAGYALGVMALRLR